MSVVVAGDLPDAAADRHRADSAVAEDAVAPQASAAPEVGPDGGAAPEVGPDGGAGPEVGLDAGAAPKVGPDSGIRAVTSAETVDGDGDGGALVASAISPATAGIDPTSQLESSPPPPADPVVGGRRWRLGQIDAVLAASFAARLHHAQQRTTERGMRAQARYVLDRRHVSVRADVRLRWNDAYRAGPPYSNEARDQYRLDGDLRELYLSSQIRGWGLSLGYQQVVWGRADQLRVLDQVNPIDLRDFVLPDLADYRIAVPMLRVNAPVFGWESELVYLPFFVPTRFAVAGSEFYLPLIGPTPPGVTVLPEARPDRGLKNGEVGLHVSRTLGAVDLSAVAFYTRDDNPVIRALSVEDPPGVPALALRPEYRRQVLLGVGVALPTGYGLVLRSELSFVPRFTYVTSASQDGLARSPTVTGLLGLDYLVRDWLLSFQASDRFIADWDRSYQVQKQSPILTFSVTGTTMSARLETRLALAIMPLHGDGSWFQYRTTYRPYQRWSGTLSVDLLDGSELGLFGQFHQQTRGRLEVAYAF